LLLSAFVIVSFVLVTTQENIIKVSAEVIPVVVMEDHLDFGTVFPGEGLEGNFVVSVSPDYQENGIQYRIIQRRKLLPPEHPEYPDGGDPQMPGYYRNLCPYLEKSTNEGEGDTEESATLSSLDDQSDAWVIYFKVPAIIGSVAQEHIGGVVDSNGEYGCDVSIDIIE
jgi:hypothetical protein